MRTIAGPPLARFFILTDVGGYNLQVNPPILCAAASVMVTFRTKTTRRSSLYYRMCGKAARCVVSGAHTILTRY